MKRPKAKTGSRQKGLEMLAQSCIEVAGSSLLRLRGAFHGLFASRGRLAQASAEYALACNRMMQLRREIADDVAWCDDKTGAIRFHEVAELLGLDADQLRASLYARADDGLIDACRGGNCPLCGRG